MDNTQIRHSAYGNTTGFYRISQVEALMELARADERAKITEETVKEYFAGFSGKETALIVLNYLLRGGITDDDLSAFRLQWIKEQPQGVDVWINGLQTEHQIWSGSDNATSEFWGILDYSLAQKLGVAKGECAKFKIVRQP